MAKKRTKKKAPAKQTPSTRPARKRAAAKTTRGAASTPPSEPDVLELLAEPLTAAPEPPERLGTHGVACWRRLTPLLVELRVLTRLDLEALEAMCHQWHDYLTWQLMIQADPALAIVEYESGARQKSPEASLRDAAYDRWLKLLPRFGLSPEHRRKLKKLKESGGGSTRGSSPDVGRDPVAEFAAAKYAE